MHPTQRLGQNRVKWGFTQFRLKQGFGLYDVIKGDSKVNN
jgi:hypothetical protein